MSVAVADRARRLLSALSETWGGGALVSYRVDWDEMKHPRDAGKFTSSPGGSKKGPEKKDFRDKLPSNKSPRKDVPTAAEIRHFGKSDSAPQAVIDREDFAQALGDYSKRMRESKAKRGREKQYDKAREDFAAAERDRKIGAAKKRNARRRRLARMVSGFGAAGFSRRAPAPITAKGYGGRGRTMRQSMARRRIRERKASSLIKAIEGVIGGGRALREALVTAARSQNE